MKTELKDVAHFYFGSEILFTGWSRTFIKKGTKLILDADTLNTLLKEPEDFKLILRPLSDITKEEFLECRKIEESFLPKSGGIFIGRAACILFLLKRSFDLFNLIESEQAINAATLNK